MTRTPEVTIVIPTRQRPELLSACVGALTRQQNAPRFEVIVTVDGPDSGESAAIRSAVAGHPDFDCTVIEGDPEGPAVARNRAIESARGDLMLLLNDDVVPDGSLVRTHMEAHEALDNDALVLGSAPWHRPHDESLFDRMVFDTSTVFFYDTMENADDAKTRDWRFRHAWTLNLSLPPRLARSVGGFST